MSEARSSQQTLSTEAVELLRRRALKLAETGEQVARRQAETTERAEPYLCFRLLGERYAMPLTVVSEVIPLRSIMNVPGAPEHVVGITRLRGQVLALVDLRRFWHGSAVGHADSDLALIVDKDGVDFGLICTQVEGLIEVASGDIRDTPQNISDRQASSLRGIAMREIMLIDPMKLCGQRNFFVTNEEEGE